MKVHECIVWLDDFLQPEAKTKLKGMKKTELIKCHHGLGRTIRNERRLWEENRNNVIDLAREIIWLHEAGSYHVPDIENDPKRIPEPIDNPTPILRKGVDYTFTHPDNISYIIMEMYWDYLNGNIELGDLEWPKKNHASDASTDKK